MDRLKQIVEDEAEKEHQEEANQEARRHQIYTTKNMKRH